MPDITMCSGEQGDTICPLRDDCYRYMAEPNSHWQSNFAEMPYKDGGCEYYISIFIIARYYPKGAYKILRDIFNNFSRKDAE